MWLGLYLNTCLAEGSVRSDSFGGGNESGTRLLPHPRAYILFSLFIYLDCRWSRERRSHPCGLFAVIGEHGGPAEATIFVVLCHYVEPRSCLFSAVELCKTLYIFVNDPRAQTPTLPFHCLASVFESVSPEFSFRKLNKPTMP